MQENKIFVELLDWWNSDRDIAESAWVSTGKNNLKRSEDEVKRVIENSIVPLSHDTPKESVWLRFYLHIPIFVERQLDKYRMTRQIQDMKVISEDGELGRWGISQNELSLRYKTMPNSYIGLSDDIKNIFNRIRSANLGNEILKENKYSELTDDYNVNYEIANASMQLAYEQTMAYLKFAKDSNIISYDELKRVREVFRGILGTSFFTDMQIILNLNAFEHICNQRLSEHAQPETREAVRQMLYCVKDAEIIPVTIDKMISVNGWKI